MSRDDYTMKEADWRAKAIELFGEDENDWAFTCPHCKLEMSVTRAKLEWPELRGKGWMPYSHCVGRFLSDIGCDWCSFGLFAGPEFVEREDGTGTNSVFPFAEPKTWVAP